MTNMKMCYFPSEAAAAECIPTKLRAMGRVPWKLIAVRKNEIT